MKTYRISLNPLPICTYSGRTTGTVGSWIHRGIIRDHDVLAVMISGVCRFNFKEREPITVRREQSIIIPAGVYYTVDCLENCDYYFFNMTPISTEVAHELAEQTLREDILLIADCDSRMHYNQRRYSHPRKVDDHLFMRERTDLSGKFANINSLLLRCDIELSKGSLTQAINFDLTFAQLLVMICEETMSTLTKRTSYPASLERILTYILTHYTEQLTLDRLSHRFGLTKQYIGKLFRRHLGMTVTAYVNDVKLSYAPELIRYTTMNVSEIAAYLGFSSANYFTRLFKEKYSITPREYR